MSKNWSGSAKAMEPDMAVKLTAKNPLLQQKNFRVGVLIGDDDSSTIAAVRRESQQPVEKWSDLNHAKKSLSNALYNLHLESLTIEYLVKCFAICIKQNKDNREAVEESIRNIVEHTYGQHTNCRKWGGLWCRYDNNPVNFKYKGLPRGEPLKDPKLKQELEKLFDKFAKNADKLAPCASSQANESFNNIALSKNTKMEVPKVFFLVLLLQLLKKIKEQST